MAYVLKPVSTDALARHAWAALAPDILAPCPLRMTFAYPSQSEADRAIRAYHSAKDL